jgi:hypothetical protein
MTRTYHKIQSVFKRDPATKFRTFIPEYSMPEFSYLSDNDWRWTEKIDGTNIRITWDGEDVTFGGRTERAQIPAHLVNKLIELFPPKKFKDLDLPPMTLFGEGYGMKIQKAGPKYNPGACDFILFDIFAGDMYYDLWIAWHNVVDIGLKLDIDVIPVIGHGTLDAAIELVREGFPSMRGDLQAEGLVLRPTIELKTRRGERIITKIKCKDFKYEKNK